jgi:peptidoglycan/LPS O-acetylase OafA/YrhL
MTSQAPIRIDALEGMRGLAAFSVLIHHFVLLIYPSFYFLGEDLMATSTWIQCLAKTPFGIWIDGHLPVRLFFVHSGFVLTYSFFYKRDEQPFDYQKLASAIFRRYFRLTLPVLFCVLFAYLIMISKLNFHLEADQLSQLNWIGKYLKFEPNLLGAFWQGVYGTYFDFSSARTYNPVLWTIAVELKASYLVYFLALMGSFFKSKMRLAIYFSSFYFFDIAGNFGAFIFGLILCELYLSRGGFAPRALWFKLGLWVVAIYFGGIKTLDHELYQWIKSFSVNEKFVFYFMKTLAAIIIIYLILISRTTQKVLSGLVPKKLGEYSYSMYLIHFPILASFSSYLLIKSVPHLVNFILTTLLVLFISAFMRQWVDLPSINLPKKLVSRLKQST